MADLNDQQAAQTVKVTGSSTGGLEDNYLGVDSNQAAKTTVRDPSTGAGVTTSLVGAKQSLDVNVTASAPNSDKTGSGTITALNGSVAVNTQGCAAVMFNVSGTWVATLTIQATLDGTTWFTVTGQDAQTGLALTTTTTNRVIAVACGGFAQVRLTATLFTSGTATIVYDAAIGAQEPVRATIGNTASTAPSQAQLVAGKDLAGNMYAVQVDDQGRLVTSAITGFGADFAFGDISTAATTRVVLRRTAYTEQTTNAQRSIASANAADTAAGTGARTVKITYYDQTGAGPFTETLTLNGVTFVNTVATNICFIEQMEVVTAGSGGVNAGILTLRAAAAGGGAIIGTINATDNQTFWAHHYVPVGKVCNITGISCGHNGTTVGSGALFTLNARPIGVANAIEAQVSDFVRLYGQSSTFARNYVSPIKVTGPARLQVYVTPETSTATIYRCAIDFFEP
jgi:hypothetical protein